jgi:hypothetical protein
MAVDWRMIRTLMLARLAGTATHCTTGLEVQPVSPSLHQPNLSRTTRPHCFFVCRFFTSNIPPAGTSLNCSRVDPSSLFKKDDTGVRMAWKDYRLVDDIQCNDMPMVSPSHRRLNIGSLIPSLKARAVPRRRRVMAFKDCCMAISTPRATSLQFLAQDKHKAHHVINYNLACNNTSSCQSGPEIS